MKKLMLIMASALMAASVYSAPNEVRSDVEVQTYNELVSDVMERQHYLPLDPQAMSEEDLDYFENKEWWTISSIHKGSASGDQILNGLSKGLSILKYYTHTKEFADLVMAQNNGDGYVTAISRTGMSEYVDLNQNGEQLITNRSVIEYMHPDDTRWSKVGNFEAVLRTRNSKPDVDFWWGTPQGDVGMRRFLHLGQEIPTNWGESQTYGEWVQAFISDGSYRELGSLFHEFQHVIGHSHEFGVDPHSTTCYIIQRDQQMQYHLYLLDGAYDAGYLPNVYLEDLRGKVEIK